MQEAVICVPVDSTNVDVLTEPMSSTKAVQMMNGWIADLCRRGFAHIEMTQGVRKAVIHKEESITFRIGSFFGRAFIAQKRDKMRWLHNIQWDVALIGESQNGSAHRLELLYSKSNNLNFAIALDISVYASELLKQHAIIDMRYWHDDLLGAAILDSVPLKVRRNGGAAKIKRKMPRGR